jgi:hypothetical protein
MHRSYLKCPCTWLTRRDATESLVRRRCGYRGCHTSHTSIRHQIPAPASLLDVCTPNCARPCLQGSSEASRKSNVEGLGNLFKHALVQSPRETSFGHSPALDQLPHITQQCQLNEPRSTLASHISTSSMSPTSSERYISVGVCSWFFVPASLGVIVCLCQPPVKGHLHDCSSAGTVLAEACACRTHRLEPSDGRRGTL